MEDYLSEIIDLIQDEKRLEKLGIMSRKRSLDMNWVGVSQELERFYQNFK